MNVKKALKRAKQYFIEFMFLEDTVKEKRAEIIKERKQEDEKINLELKGRIQAIKEDNAYKLIMNHYVPIVAEQALRYDGLLIGEHQTVYTATQRMLLDKRNGKIDEFYNLIEDTEDVKK